MGTLQLPGFPSQATQYAPEDKDLPFFAYGYIIMNIITVIYNESDTLRQNISPFTLFSNSSIMLFAEYLL